MKNLLLSVALLLTLVVGCHSDDSIGPASLLYKRWHVFQTRGVNDSTWAVYDADAYYDTEYRPDGTLIYRRNGILTSVPCCSSSRFERNGVIIQYIDFLSGCPYTKCGANSPATITILSTNLLELQIGNQLTQYTPAQ
ncbi:hypothetical protein GO730_18570 [Spirosoma sp. HMF3257]|uniref:Lipocalin family protein n=1 Tax=Spirosoma telluris TaxID=2183553 RepID=A0A327NNS1_9BACT|nr:hypothetical protein [Spirosoma telluris]RAI75646.1 hypothetical protein HMF3257_18500 [Spirosoma telluris]